MEKENSLKKQLEQSLEELKEGKAIEYKKRDFSNYSFFANSNVYLRIIIFS